MTATAFEKVMEHIFKHEAGYVDHPRDPGGATNMGITRRTLAQWRGVSIAELPKSEVMNLSKEEARAIYKARYWDSIRGDDLPDGLDYAVMDFAVNSGVSRAVRYLQRIVGQRQDGIMGGMTMNAIKRYNPIDLVEQLCVDRLAFLKSLSTWDAFGRGWSRRVNAVKRDGVDMARNGGGGW